LPMRPKIPRQIRGPHTEGFGAPIRSRRAGSQSCAAEQAGIRAVLLHAMTSQAKRFYQRGGFQESPVDPLTMMITMVDINRALGSRSLERGANRSRPRRSGSARLAGVNESSRRRTQDPSARSSIEIPWTAILVTEARPRTRYFFSVEVQLMTTVSGMGEAAAGGLAWTRNRCPSLVTA
jgi:hypothetical protein